MKCEFCGTPYKSCYPESREVEEGCCCNPVEGTGKGMRKECSETLEQYRAKVINRIIGMLQGMSMTKEEGKRIMDMVKTRCVLLDGVEKA